MSWRFHIIASRNSNPEEMRAVFGQVGDFDFCEENGWLWNSTSVWTVDRAVLLECLESLEGPSMMITTQDGCRWFLHLRRKGLEPFVICHEFGDLPEGGDSRAGIHRIDFQDEFFNPDEEEDEDPIADLLDTYRLVGCPLPEEITERLLGLRIDKALQVLFDWQANSILDALDRFGIDHPRREVIETIRGIGVTEDEFGTDVGNLFRFLHHLGIVKPFREMMDQFERDRVEMAAMTEDDLEDDDDFDLLRDGPNDPFGVAFPSTGKVILPGECLPVREADLSNLQPESLDLIASTDRRAKEHGFEYLGDLISDFNIANGLRFYSGKEIVYLALYLGPETEAGIECYSTFQDGQGQTISLTTTTKEGFGSNARQGILFRTTDSKEIAQVLAEHRMGVGKIQTHGYRPNAVEATLLGAARAIDEFLIRRVEW